MSQVNVGGRPFKFQDPDELEKSINKYFDETPKNEWTVTGLCLLLECDRETLLCYEQNRQGQHENVDSRVISLIKRAKMKIHNAYESDLRFKARPGDIFALKNFGWKDTFENTHNVNAPKPLLDSILTPDGSMKEDKNKDKG